MALHVVTTDLGRAAILDAEGAGLSVSITEIGIGSASYQPQPTRTALEAEVTRIGIANSRIDDVLTQLEISAVLEDESSYWIGELGFFAADGTLIWVWSAADNPLVYKAAAVRLLLGLTLIITDIDIGSVEIVDGGQDLELWLTPIEEGFGQAILTNANLHIADHAAIQALEQRVRVCEGMLARLFPAVVLPPIGSGD